MYIFKNDTAGTVRVVTCSTLFDPVHNMLDNESGLCLQSCTKFSHFNINEDRRVSLHTTHIFPEDVNVASRWRHDVVCCMKNIVNRKHLPCLLTILSPISCMFYKRNICSVFIRIFRRRSLSGMTYEFRVRRHAPIFTAWWTGVFSFYWQRPYMWRFRVLNVFISV